MAKNKVKYNLKNAHYAMLKVNEEGVVSFDTPVALPGAVSISLDANGEPENFYADGVAYYVINNNMGYDGDLELAIIPEDFRVSVLNETLDDNKVLIENANSEFASSIRTLLSSKVSFKADTLKSSGIIASSKSPS